MSFAPHVWSQIKNLSKKDFIKALEKDGWTLDPKSKGAELGYIKHGSPNRRIVIHFHPKQTFGPKILKAVIADTGWTEADLRKVGLIK